MVIVSGEKIKQLRINAEMSQQELADKSHISQYYISKIEKGESQPTIPVATAIATALGVEIPEILITVVSTA